MKHLIAISLAFLFVVQFSYSQNTERISVLNNFIEQSVADGIVPGGVFMINHKGKEIFNKTIGNVDVEGSRAYKEDDIFRIASMTKAITTVAIMQLYENGQLQIDDPVSKFIPAFANTKVIGDYNEADTTYTVKDLDRQVTLRHLLTHTSGIYYGSFAQGMHRAIYAKNNAMLYGLSLPNVTTLQMVNHIATLPLAHQPGTRWTYGLNMEVLGGVVEVVSGMSLGDYVQQHILDPLGMSDTHYYIPHSKAARLVPVYMQLEQGTIMSPDSNLAYPLSDYTQHYAGGGGMSSTAGDYMRFIETLLNGGTMDGTRILGRKTVEYMAAEQTQHLTRELTDHTRPKGSAFGLGFAVVGESGKGAVPFSIGTYSWGGYFNTKFWIDPVEELTFVGMTQVVPFRHGEFWDKLYAIIYSVLD